jgi:hypothetical protein
MKSSMILDEVSRLKDQRNASEIGNTVVQARVIYGS